MSKLEQLKAEFKLQFRTNNLIFDAIYWKLSHIIDIFIFLSSVIFSNASMYVY